MISMVISDNIFNIQLIFLMIDVYFLDMCCMLWYLHL